MVLAVLETQRCFLNPLRKYDKAVVRQLYENKQVRCYLGGPVTGKEFDNCFDKLLTGRDALHWIIRLKTNSSFVGMLSIAPHHDGDEQEISYQILPDFWGQGLARETISSLIDHADRMMNLPCIVAETQLANVASIKLLESLGLQRIKTLSRFGEEQCLYRRQF